MCCIFDRKSLGKSVFRKNFYKVGVYTTIFDKKIVKSPSSSINFYKSVQKIIYFSAFLYFFSDENATAVFIEIRAKFTDAGRTKKWRNLQWHSRVL